MKQFETATETVLLAMEKFGKAEATALVIIWSDEEDRIHLMSNTPLAHLIGMAHYAAEAEKRQMFEE